MKSSLVCPVVAVLGCIVFALGCSKADVDKLVNQVKDQAQSIQQEAKAKVIPVGSIQFSLNGEVTCPSGNAALLIVGDGRPNVLQVRSYSNMDNESFPSILFQATTNANSYQELIGQTVSGDLFIALDSRTSFWQSETEQVSIAIRGIEESEMVGQFGPVSVKNPEGKTASASGSFRAIMAPL